MNIALIAHDKKKDGMIELAKTHTKVLQKHRLCATGTTGSLITKATGLKIHCYLTGPMGGDQQIGSLVAANKLDLVIFLRDPLTMQAHEPDITALLRLCDVHNIPHATNISSADVMLRALDKGALDFRYAINPPDPEFVY